jgi:glutamyl/glutaminyl-tRNA synthetase
VLKVQKPGAVQALIGVLEKFTDAEFNVEKLSHVVKDTVTALGLKMPDLGKPARVLLTGGLSGPDLGVLMAALGKTKTLERLGQAAQFA